MPATIASTVRGNRTVCTMSLISVSRWSESGDANSPRQTSPGLNARAPTASDAAPATTRTAASTPSPAIRRRRAAAAPDAGRFSVIVLIHVRQAGQAPLFPRNRPLDEGSLT
jgi:hypothetical protein